MLRQMPLRGLPPWGRLFLLCIFATQGWAQTIVVGNYTSGDQDWDGTQGGGVPLTDPSLWAAVSFTTPGVAYDFVKMTAYIGNTSASVKTIEGGIYSDSSNDPGSLLATFNALSVTSNDTGSPYEMTVTGGYALATNTTYWLVLHDAPSGPVWAADIARTTPVVSNGFTFGSYRQSGDSGTTWNSTNYEINDKHPGFDLVVMAAVPEPSSYAVLLGIGVLGFVTCRRQRRVD